LTDSVEDKQFLPRQVSKINKSGFIVATGNKFIQINRVQLSGSKEMSAGDFARGQRLEVGYIFKNHP